VPETEIKMFLWSRERSEREAEKSLREMSTRDRNKNVSVEWGAVGA
jgi:hypothetical protein